VYYLVLSDGLVSLTLIERNWTKDVDRTTRALDVRSTQLWEPRHGIDRSAHNSTLAPQVRGYFDPKSLECWVSVGLLSIM